MLEEEGVLDEAQDLAEECDGLLVELLGIADVGRDDLLKGKAGESLMEESPVLLRLHSQLATHGVLGGADVRVDVVDVEPSATGRPHCADLVEGDGLAERWMARREAVARQQRLRGTEGLYEAAAGCFVLEGQLLYCDAGSRGARELPRVEAITKRGVAYMDVVYVNRSQMMGDGGTRTGEGWSCGWAAIRANTTRDGKSTHACCEAGCVLDRRWPDPASRPAHPSMIPNIGHGW